MRRKGLTISIILVLILIVAGGILWFSRKHISEKHLLKGTALFQEKKYTESLDEFQKAYRWYGRSARALLGKAEAEYFLNQFGPSANDIQNSLAIDSSLVDAYFYRGLLSLKANEQAKAIVDFSKVISMDSVYARAYYHRGLAKAALSDFTGFGGRLQKINGPGQREYRSLFEKHRG